jgi:hypothetical protein
MKPMNTLIKITVTISGLLIIVSLIELRLHHDTVALYYVLVAMWMMLPVIIIKQ